MIILDDDQKKLKAALISLKSKIPKEDVDDGTWAEVMNFLMKFGDK